MESATVMRTRYRGLFESSLWEHDSAADARMRQAMAETPLETPLVRLLALEREQAAGRPQRASRGTVLNDKAMTPVVPATCGFSRTPW
jgi:hypothetical protein